MSKYEIKAKIVKAGASKVFQSWNHYAGITMDDFLDGLKWLCDDPMDEQGRYTRELGCVRHPDAGMSEDEKALWGEVPHTPGIARLYRLTRCYTQDGGCAFYDEDGHIWGGTTDYASISAGDRV